MDEEQVSAAVENLRRSAETTGEMVVRTLVDMRHAAEATSRAMGEWLATLDKSS